MSSDGNGALMLTQVAGEARNLRKFLSPQGHLLHRH
jgi:hypothetical protein